MGYFSRAISITKSDTINSLPAWEFMNQTGTLGTFLAGSLVYVGGAGDVNVIVAGTLGPQNTVVDFQAITVGGTGYTGANGVATTGGSGTGLTVNTTDTNNVITAAVVNAAGSGYKVGDVVTISGGNGNAKLTIADVKSLLPLVSQGVEFSGLQPGDTMPVYVDYVLSTDTSATLLVAGRESSLG